MILLEQVRRLAVERAASNDELAALDRALGAVPDGVGRSAGLAERERDELLEMVARGQLRRAVVLSREHVARHPEDIVIGVLLEVLLTALGGHPPDGTAAGSPHRPSHGDEEGTVA